MRRVARRYTSPVDTTVVLECGHIVVEMPKMRMVRIYCQKCADADKLPNTVKEIWSKYWHGIPRF
jgi:hypothetical protein